MSVRCHRCGRFTSTYVGFTPSLAIEVMCLRCYTVTALDDVCHEEVADRQGWTQPCDRPAFDVHQDPEGAYPVCRMHWRHYETLREAVAS